MAELFSTVLFGFVSVFYLGFKIGAYLRMMKLAAKEATE